MIDNITVLCGTAASVGFLHTLLGPDHYLPFIAMSRAGRWSLKRTVIVTLLCGVGHVLSSTVLGMLGIIFGVAVFKLERLEGVRGDLAGWLLLAFGFLYFVWGVRSAVRNRPHTHWHTHSDGTLHEHEHRHTAQHLHVHAEVIQAGATSSQALVKPECDRSDSVISVGRPSSRKLTPWILFVIFAFGPCEILIPILMYPAAKGDMWSVVLVTLVFALTTLVTMTGVVMGAYLAAGRVAFRGLSRYGHALAGLVLLLCGAAMKAGM